MSFQAVKDLSVAICDELIRTRGSLSTDGLSYASAVVYVLVERMSAIVESRDNVTDAMLQEMSIQPAWQCLTEWLAGSNIYAAALEVNNENNLVVAFRYEETGHDYSTSSPLPMSSEQVMRSGAVLRRVAMGISVTVHS